MTSLRDLQTNLARHAPEIVADLNAATEGEPWAGLPKSERINNLEMLIVPLIELALSDTPNPTLCGRALFIAARHGERRRLQGLPEGVILQDLYHFRNAICSHVEHPELVTLYTDAICRIDRLLSIACYAAMRGFYRQEFEARGEWPGAIDDLGRGLGPFPAHCGVSAV